MDFARDPATGWTNVGLRRLMLRGRATTGIDLVAPSDLRTIYLATLARGERLPLSVVVGGHPIDYFGATMRLPVRRARAARHRCAAAPMPVVKSITNDIRIPADAEWVLEGYLGEEGYRRAGRTLRRIPWLLRRREDQSGLSRHRHHAPRATRCSRP